MLMRLLLLGVLLVGLCSLSGVYAGRIFPYSPPSLLSSSPSSRSSSGCCYSRLICGLFVPLHRKSNANPNNNNHNNNNYNYNTSSYNNNNSEDHNPNNSNKSNNSNNNNSNNNDNRSSSSGSGEYYAMLGVSSMASERDIKAAYRQKALHMHPDKGGDTEAFKQLNEAYETLVNPTTRARYDQLGWPAYKSNVERGMPSDGNGNDDYFTSDLARELFARFRGSSARFVNSPLVVNVQLQLEEIEKGKRIAIDIDALLRGTMSASKKANEIEIDIPAGITDGASLVVRDIPFTVGTMQLQKDLVIRISQVPHSRFKRVDEDLITELNVTLREFLFGITGKSLGLLNGTTIQLSTPQPQLQSLSLTQYYVIPGAGLPKLTKSSVKTTSSELRGSLYIQFRVDLSSLVAVHSMDLVQMNTLHEILTELDVIAQVNAKKVDAAPVDPVRKWFQKVPASKKSSNVDASKVIGTPVIASLSPLQVPSIDKNRDYGGSEYGSDRDDFDDPIMRMFFG